MHDSWLGFKTTDIPPFALKRGCCDFHSVMDANNPSIMGPLSHCMDEVGHLIGMSWALVRDRESIPSHNGVELQPFRE